MADPRPWSNDEKNELLAEIIKAASPSPGVLFNVVTSLNLLQPRWDDLPLPRGRSLNASRFAFDDLQRSYPLQPLSFSPSTMYGPATPLSAPPPGLGKRPFHHPLEPAYPAAGREIRPKPLPPQGSVPPLVSSEPPLKRKRGRPSKAQIQAKAAAEAAAAGQAGPASRATQRGSPLVETTPAPQFSEEAKSSLQPASRMPISAVLTPTAPKTASSSSSSSGKRRRGRSMRSEQEAFAAGGAVAGMAEYESPYGRAIGGGEGTPARTAVLRHREDAGLPPQQQQEQPQPQQDPAMMTSTAPSTT